MNNKKSSLKYNGNGNGKSKEDKESKVVIQNVVVPKMMSEEEMIRKGKYVLRELEKYFFIKH